MAEESATKIEYQWLVKKIEHADSIALNQPSRRSIYRVPDSLRELNKEAYTPQLISIGPFHYSSQKLQSMENLKLRYLKSFMERTKINKEKLARIIQDSEESVRGYYAEAITFDRDTLRQIILVDASFIIEFFLRDLSDKLTEDDSILVRPWQQIRMELDLILLENQLPFFIIKKLYELLPLQSRNSTYPSSFLELTVNFFRIWNPQQIRHDRINSEEVMHFTDLLRYFILPPPPLTLPNRSLKIVDEMFCASQLAEAGLKFKPSSSGSSIVDLKFNEGVLEIPKYKLHDDVEIYPRNLVALEHCVYPVDTYVTDYFMMLDFLINTGKDVDILVQGGILVNEQGTNSRPPLPCNLCTGISYRFVSDDYYDLCRKLVNFRKKHWHVILKSSLKHDYFRTPWMGAATVGTIILLILTLVQTVCTVISIFK